jgi:hypothetical protein
MRIYYFLSNYLRIKDGTMHSYEEAQHFTILGKIPGMDVPAIHFILTTIKHMSSTWKMIGNISRIPVKIKYKHRRQDTIEY